MLPSAAAAMKTSIDHLPEKKRAKIAAMVAAIRSVPEVEMILLFGSHARGEQVSDLDTGYVSDYDLLVVVDNPKAGERAPVWSEVRKKVDRFAQPATAPMIIHDVRELNQEIRRGQFFFSEIVAQGIVLYDSKRFALARPKAATPEERKELAQEYFDQWFTTAEQFFVAHEFMRNQGWLPLSAFQLHQATERYFAAALLVFVGTKPTIHDLEKLSALVAPLHPLLAEPFPMANEDDKHLFDLLRKAYIEARYKKSYRITAEELVALGGRVRDLAGRVERACRERIASFA
jgi:uncharacterized protein